MEASSCDNNENSPFPVSSSTTTSSEDVDRCYVNLCGDEFRISLPDDVLFLVLEVGKPYPADGLSLGEVRILRSEAMYDIPG